MKNLILATVVWLLVLCPFAPAANSEVFVVVGPDAPRLERFAAAELAGQFRLLFGVNVQITDRLPSQGSRLILLGSPRTNPVLKTVVAGAWPRLTEQGHLLRSVKHNDGTALVVGGGSPVAVLWAVYELGHRFGIRHLLGGDAMPAARPALKLQGFDAVLEPLLQTRAWRTINDFAIGPESWGLAEHRKFLGQLAKLKFNRILISVYAWQPFVHFEFRGVKKTSALLWYGHKYPVDGDAGGRAAFKGATEFTNPDFAGKASYDDRVLAGTRLMHGIIDAAHELGMTVGLMMSPLEFPREFAAVLPGAKPAPGPEQLLIGPGRSQPPDDPNLMGLARAQLQAYVRTYPQLDALYLTLPEFPDWVEHHEASWRRLDKRTGLGRLSSLPDLLQAAGQRPLIASGERGRRALQGNIAGLDFIHGLLSNRDILRTSAGKQLETVLVQVDPALFPVLGRVLPRGSSALHFIDYTARRVAAQPELLAKVPAREVQSDLILTLADDNIGVLPQLATEDLARLHSRIHSLGWRGYATRYWIPGDLDPCTYYLSRAAFDKTMTPKAAYEEMITAICGPGVAERMLRVYSCIEQATALTDRNDLGFAFPVPGMILKHYSAASPPAWWREAQDLYTRAYEDTLRAKQRAHDGAQSYLHYIEKRLEFAMGYLAAVEAVRLAGNARAKNDTGQQLKHLESAVEALYGALNAYGEVARDNSDRGVIAVVNTYGYRPLLAEFETVERARQKPD